MRPIRLIGAAIGLALCSPLPSGAAPAVPILVYHRFGAVRVDSMTVTTEHFKQQLDLLRKTRYSVIPLSDFVAWKLGKGPAPPSRSVVLTFDDGHVSVYKEARPVITSNRIPVTLFIYPSCISHASYAMTWQELSELITTPFFTVQSHTFWHPNFQQESNKLDHAGYAAFVDKQLRHSEAVLETRLERPINLLAWPFGIYNSYLMDRASSAGYRAGFSIECRAATASDPIMAIPRCLVSDEEVGPRFLRFLDSAIRRARH